MKWCIRYLWCSPIILYSITSITYDRHTDTYPLLNIQTHISIYRGWGNLREFAYPVGVVLLLQVLTQFSGGVVVRNYAADSLFAGSSQALLCMALLGLVKVAFTLVTVYVYVFSCDGIIDNNCDSDTNIIIYS